MECPECGEDMIREYHDGGDSPVNPPGDYWLCPLCGYANEEIDYEGVYGDEAPDE